MTDVDAADEVHVVYRADDIRSLYGACRKCRRSFWWIAAIPILFGFLAFTEGHRGMGLAVYTLPYLLIAIIAGFSVYYLVPLVQVRARQKNGFGKPMLVRLTEESVETQMPSQDSQFFWSAIQDVVVKKGRLFFFTTPGCAIILPRRCFADEGQFMAWARRAEGYWASAKDSSGQIE